jgi:catalase
VEIIGKMVLDRNPDNFFAETEQVAFCPSHVVPGIDFSEDPLLQGRLFSYLDTQLSRLGSPNFHQLPINAPKCPFANMQRDGHMQMQVHKGRGNYEPNSIEPKGERETASGFRTAPVPLEGTKVRLRPESFADHYSQARLFYRSVTPQEQKHMAMALTFELSKVEIPEIRRKMLGHLEVIDEKLAAKVADGLGMSGEAIPATPAAKPIDLDPSPALRLYGKYKPTLKGRKIGVLLADGFDAKLQSALMAAIKKEGATPAIIAPKVGGVMDSTGKKMVAEMALSGSPSVFFDAVAVLAGPNGDKALSAEPDAVSFLMDADRHLKAIALAGVAGLSKKTHVDGVVGVTQLGGSGDISKFIDFARDGKVWERDTA